MAIVKMRKVFILSLQKHKQSIIEELIKAGVMHIADLSQNIEYEDEGIVEKDAEDTSELINEIEKLKHVIEYLSKYACPSNGKKQGNIPYSYSQLTELKQKQKHDIFELGQRVYDIDKSLANLNNRQVTIFNRLDELKPWAALDINYDELDGTATTEFLIGTVPISVTLSRATQIISEEAPQTYIEQINEQNGQRYLFVACHKDIIGSTTGALSKLGFIRVIIKDVDSTINKEIEKLNSELAATSSEKAALEKRLKDECVTQIYRIKALYDCLSIEKDKKEAIKNLIKTDSTFMIQGWVPYNEVTKLQNSIDSVTQDYWMEIKQPEKGEQHPIMLKNHPLVEPFELITQLFSLPNANEVDPNTIMAPFFFIFFGIMIGDAGYGIVMSIIAWIAWRKLKPKGIAQKMIALIFLCGISTAFWGALFGSWFGNIFDVFKLPVKAIWFNPMEDPMKLLMFSFALGVIHLFAGIGVKAYRSIKEGKWLDAVLDQGFWYIFILGLIFLFIPGMKVAGKYMAIIGAAVLILTQGRNEKNIIKRLLAGVLSLYGASGFMSDVLSYSRLLALGLSTGVIATVINTMGSLPGFSFFGIIIFVLAFLIGHIFNILINLLGAYVHSSRLQYVEFFGKFYEGGGKAYSPFKITTKYTNINNEEE